MAFLLLVKAVNMGDVHQLHTSANAQARLLEQWITQITSQHPDRAVAERWSELARETVKKFPGPPTPSRSEIDLNQLSSLSAEDKEQVFGELEQFMSSYFNDVRQQLMLVHKELLELQKRVAELEAKG